MSYFARGTRGLFSSAHLGAHLLRGAASLGLVCWAVAHQVSHPIGAVFAGFVALVTMRGCPMCWLIGLFDTVADRCRKPMAVQDHQPRWNTKPPKRLFK